MMQGRAAAANGWQSAFMAPTEALARQHEATLAAWLGVPADQLGAVFPNIDKFGSANLGFMG